MRRAVELPIATWRRLTGCGGEQREIKAISPFGLGDARRHFR
jgi:hypothetical protein